MLSGDWIPVSLPDRVRAAFPGTQVTSLGGATEATVWSNFYPVAEVDPRWPSIPYGRPIHNALYHVLDAGLEPCPVGVPGDLYIGGEVLCTGYAGQPAVTAAAFIPDPFVGAGRAGARLYRTGDRARYFADGNLEFLGRLDQQVKIRGFRIELGEIEVALARHPQVREAVVLARGEAGDKRLVAYVVPPVGEEAPGKAELRDFLRRALPDYMIPWAFVPLAALPVTANGKLDRRALPAPVRETLGEDVAAHPLTPTEETLAGLWRELLGIERVAVTDNFFDLGGHSLLATQLVARLRQAFAAEVPLRTLFQTPNLSALAAALDALAPAAAGAPFADAAGCPIQPVPREGGLPLSASQLRQWFLVQLEPESVDYNLPLAFSLKGELRPEALAAALREIVRRHEALRVTFTAVAGRPAAVATPDVILPLPLLDLSALPEAARRDAAGRLTAEEHDRPFDLTRGPLLRTLLIRLSASEHLLAATVHHIVFDGWSLGVFLGELAALYEAFAAGRPSPLPELPVQYADYAAWQQEWLASPDLDARLAHWKERLGGSAQALELPTDRPRPTVQTHRGELLPLAVPPELAASLKALAAREGVTLFMLLLSGFAALLSRYTGQEDLNVGTFVANRRWEALERLIGFFVNTLVLRADLTGEPSFRELLARSRDTALDAFDHQEVPIERLLDELDTERDLSRPPLFQVMFGVQNFAMPDQEVPGLSIRPVEVTEHSRTNADLAFWMWEQGEGLAGWLQFSTDLYDGATVQRMFGHLASLLAGAVTSPGQRLSELPLLAVEERRQIMGWSAAPAHPETPRPVHERMREQARRAPEAVAVMAGDLSLTYAELDRRSGLVARGLRRLGAGPETVVGLSIDRSPEMIVALFGILRAGAAYLPLDPKLPADRLTLLMADAGVTGVLTRSGLAAELPPLPARVLRVDGDFEDREGPEETAVLPESTAYVLYTSGSTGAPKGVVVEHRALAAFVEAAVETYGIGPHDRVLQFASLSFDTSAEEIYPCLAAGGTLVLRDDEMIASPGHFLDACLEAGVTVLDLPTAYWHELAAAAGGAPPLPVALRLIILGGEAVLPERVRGWLAATGPRPRLFNTYGPTEGTVVATACDLGETAPAVPIGQPLRGVEAHLLDRGMWPVPAGVAGEICLGGAGLARGYLGRPDTTAERFVPAPSGPPGARLYRTGDLGRWGKAGQIEFAGRADDQVKIRGFRIEPGEVAAVLARHPAVGEVFVAARESGPGERRLVAYAVPREDARPAVAELRAFLKERLPAYMVPSDLVLLAALPRTRTGKVDRRALAAHGVAAPEPESYTPPSTLTEELIAAIWQELLGAGRVGIYDNFFDLGGHSLLAPQVFSRIEDTFEVRLPLRVLFEAPTVAEMSNAVEQILLEQIEGLTEEEAADLAGSEH
jgi:amino acid adenylation domain-containing protein